MWINQISTYFLPAIAGLDFHLLSSSFYLLTANGTLVVAFLMPSSKPTSFLLTNYLLLFGAGLIWGSQYFLNKIALESFSTSMIAAGRIGIGVVTLTLLLVAGAEKKNLYLPQRSFWRALPDFLLIGFFEATLPCLLVAWAQLRLASSVTAVLIGTVPLFATFLEVLFVKDRRLSLQKSVGVMLGFLGVVVLMSPELLASTRSDSLHSTSILLPALAVLTSALCFALSMILIQVRLGPRFGPIRSAQGILLGAGISIMPLMLWIAKPWTITTFHPTFSAVIALITLGIFCGGVVYTLFVVLINRAGPSFASMTNYLVPPIGAFIGIAFSGEKITAALMGSLLLILFSLWLSSGKRQNSS